MTGCLGDSTYILEILTSLYHPFGRRMLLSIWALALRSECITIEVDDKSHCGNISFQGLQVTETSNPDKYLVRHVEIEVGRVCAGRSACCEWFPPLGPPDDYVLVPHPQHLRHALALQQPAERKKRKGTP